MKARTVLAVLLVAAAHLALTAYCLVASLYFMVPGEPGFDPGAAQRAAFFGRALHILGFPLLAMLSAFPQMPLSHGLAGWLWLALNSLLWGAAIVLVWRNVVRRIALRPQERLDAG